MLRIYQKNQKDLSLFVERFSSRPIYIYENNNKNVILYSENLDEIINSSFFPGKLAINNVAISHLLLTSIVPPPLTVYRNFYKLSYGLEAKLSTKNNLVTVNFEEKEFFIRDKKNNLFEDKNESFLFERIYKYIQKYSNKSLPSYLFQSSGKDSNIIALAYSEFGTQNDITCLTYDNGEDLHYAQLISKKLGINHIKLEILDETIVNFKKIITSGFEKTFFPCTDNAYIGYFLFNNGLLNKQSNLIDGMGNDIFIGHVPKLKEFLYQFLSKFFEKFDHLSKFSNSLIINELFKKRFFWTGLVGFDKKSSYKLYDNYLDVENFYKSTFNNQDDYFTIRSKIRGRYIDQEKFILKLQSFCHSCKSNSIFPWTDPELSDFFFHIDKKYLFNKYTLKNKLILRNILKRNLNLDFDKIGKKDFKFNYWKIMYQNITFIEETIVNCSLFNNLISKEIFQDLLKNINKNKITSNRSKTLICQLFQICLWYNTSQFIRK